MLRLVNRNEILIPFLQMAPALNLTALTEDTGVRWQPTATKDACGNLIAPFNGIVKAFLLMVSEVGVVGTSADLINKYFIRNGGLNGAGTTKVTEDIVVIDIVATPDVLPAAGAKLMGLGISAAYANRVAIGDMLEVQFVESGTVGDATRPIVSPIGIVMKADYNIDPMHPMNVRG